MSLVRDTQKCFKEMGWFPDQQNGYDVIKIIDLGEKRRVGQSERGKLVSHEAKKNERRHLGPLYLLEET